MDSGISATDDRVAADRSALDRIFEPASIAVVGASADPAKRGYQIVRALTESDFAGAVYPVNPRGGELLGLPVTTSVEELPDGVDLAVLCTPAESAPDLVRACGARGLAGVVVLAVGFGESGLAGRQLEERLGAAAREAGVRVIGPNTSGLLNLERGVNLVGARDVRAGGMAVLVQSGNMALALMTEVTERSWDGISIYLGVGNELDLGFAEALGYLEGHEETRAVLAYVEGLRDAGRFLSVAARVSASKPVVLLKSGRTARGSEAALSHTGAVSGPYERLHAGLRQAGVVELTRADELLHVGETLGRQPAPPVGTGIAILSDGGGQGTLAVDQLVEAGARLAELSDGTRDRLRTLLGPAAAVSNPVDLAGAADADPEAFGRAMDVLVTDPSVGVVFVIGLFGGYGVRFADSLTGGEVRAAEAMANAAGAAGCGLVVHTMYAAHRTAPLETLGVRGVPVVGSLDVACRCVVELQRRGVWLARPAWEYEASPRAVGPATREGKGAPGGVEGRRSLSEPEARTILADAGMDFGPWRVEDSADGVAAALESLAGPVVVKLVSSVITHKSDAGGVVLGVESQEAARAAYEAVAGGARRQGVPDPISVLVAPHLPTPRAELLVGAFRDPALGPVLSIGAGGVWVEALGDASVRILPVDDPEIESMLAELHLWPVLQGGRGFASVDLAPVIAVAKAVADTMRRREEVLEVEVNPLFVYEDRAIPVDARIVVGDCR